MRVCVASNPAVLRHRHPGAGHPERPERIHAIQEALVAAGLHREIEIHSGREAALEELLRAHDAGYIERLKERVSSGRGRMGPDIFYSPGTWPAVRSAAGAGVGLVSEALQCPSGSSFFGLALCRPPGHHAGVASGQGFCLVNNVVVAAKAALAAGAGRVAIVDWDAHHGNGTQEIFYESSSVLVMSCHRHPYYPNTGSADAIGSGDGRGYNINVELQKGMGDDEMLAAFRRVFIPELVRFGPDITLVSAGFDGHRWELLGGLEMSEHGYGRVARELFGALEEIGSGRVVAVLEGGYDPEALGKCVVAVIEGVLDRPSYRVPHFEERPCRSFVSSLDRLRASVEEARRSSRLSSYPE